VPPWTRVASAKAFDYVPGREKNQKTVEYPGKIFWFSVNAIDRLLLKMI